MSEKRPITKSILFLVTDMIETEAKHERKFGDINRMLATANLSSSSPLPPETLEKSRYGVYECLMSVSEDLIKSFKHPGQATYYEVKKHTQTIVDDMINDLVREDSMESPQNVFFKVLLRYVIYKIHLVLDEVDKSIHPEDKSLIHYSFEPRGGYL